LVNRWLLFIRLRAISLLEYAAHGLYPRNSVQGGERDARRQLRREYKDYFALLELTYNLVVRFNAHFHDRELRSLSACEQAALLLFARIANALRGILEDAQSAYGPDACGQAASLFEFCWITAYLCGDEQAAKTWLKRKHLSEGMDVRIAIRRFMTRHSVMVQQAETEYEVYRRLNAFKHASPAWLSFHDPQDWRKEGTLRIGPDMSPHGQWALCFSLEASSQLVLMTLAEATSELLPKPTKELPLTHEIEVANKMRLRLHAAMQKRWGVPELEA
jgi:hypothetical protein